MQSDQSATDKSSSEADVISDLMEQESRTGRNGWNENVIGRMCDDDETQDMMRRLRSSMQVSAEIHPKPSLEGLKRLLHERKQGMKTWQWQEAVVRKTEQQRRRREEMVREREQQKQDEAQNEMERQNVQPEMRIGFGRCKGRTCESIYREERNYCEWLSRQ